MTNRFAFGLWLLPADAREQLAPGEQPLAWERLLTTVADDRIGKNPRGRIVTGFSFDPVAGGIRSDDGFVERMIGGASATGAADSVAAGWARAVESTTSQHVLVTDRRLLLAEEVDHPAGGRDGKGHKRRTITVHAGIPRAAVAEVRHRPRPLLAGRLQVVFTDGSTVALTTGVVSWRPARRVVRAIRAGTPQNP